MEIILVRHGKPKSAVSRKVNAAGFAQWVRQYQQSLVCDHSRPDDNFATRYRAHYRVASDLPRAQNSCVIASGQEAQQVCRLFREMDIPRYKLPFQINTWSWVYLNRLLWILGKRGRFESYREAKVRARQATAKLVSLAEQHEKVVLFAHGYLNLHIRRYLRQLGWRLITSSNQYWGVSKLIWQPSESMPK